MDMSLPELHSKYLRHGLFDDPNFKESVVEESIHGSSWTLRRSYTHEGYTRQEHFDIRLFDEDSIPHVRCSLRLVVQCHESPQHDTRHKIFKPGMWIGPDLEIETIEQQPLLPPTTQRCIEGNGFKAKYNSVEYRILATAKAFREGSQILVNKPQDKPAQILEAIRSCVRGNIKNEPRLLVFWQQLKDKRTPKEKLYSETCSHIKSLRIKVASVEHVGKYMAPLFLENTTRYLGEAFRRVRKLISQLSTCYAVTALTTFTFLEVGGLKFASLGRVAVDNEKFLYDALIALFDLLLLRLAATGKETEQEATIPTLNPMALLWWYEGEQRSYEETCKESGLSGFNRATQDIYSEESCNNIFCEIGERLTHATRLDIEHDIIGEDNVTENDSAGYSPNKSKAFILMNAQRLARFISHEEQESFAAAFEGCDKDHEDMRFALRILNGDELHENILGASIAVVNIIVDILLYTPPTTGAKRKRALAIEANESTIFDTSRIDQSPQETEPDESQMDFENRTSTGLGEWVGPAELERMDTGAVPPADFLPIATLDFAAAFGQFSESTDQSPLPSQFNLNNFQTDIDFGGLDICDGLLEFGSYVDGDASLNLSPTASQIRPSGGFL